MNIIEYDLVVIGGGPGGMAAAVEAKESGIDNVVIIEREDSLGGILKQCIHNGFGLHYFKEELTGPEYSLRMVEKIEKLKIQTLLQTMVIAVNEDKTIIATSEDKGIVIYKAKSIVLAMGCRERPRGAIRIPGTNPSGVITAGVAQKFVNLEGMLPGKDIVILGSGDIGLIMARRLTLEGLNVKCVCEIQPHPGGLTRNIVQCLDDFDIELKLKTTVVSIHGKNRLEGVTIGKVDERFNVIEETKSFIPCDTLLLSIGLIPENELSVGMGVNIDRITQGAMVNQHLETSVKGVFACGNVLHVHDLVDFVTIEGINAAKSAVKHIKNQIQKTSRRIKVMPTNGIRYVMPQYIDLSDEKQKVKIYFRSSKVFKDVKTFAKDGENILKTKKNIRLIPSEMEFIEINTDEIQKDEITVGVIEK